MAYAEVFTDRLAARPAPAERSYELREVAEFIASTEPENVAAAHYAAEEARDIANIASAIRSAAVRISARSQTLTVGKAVDEDELSEFLADAVFLALDMKAAGETLLRAELASLSSTTEQKAA